MAYNPVRTSGSLTATGSVTLGIGGEAVALIAVTGTYTGVSTIIEGSVDGTNYFTVQAYAVSNGAQTTGTTVLSAANKAWYVYCTGLTHLRLRVTAISTGTVAVVISEVGSVMPVKPATTLQYATSSGKSTGTVAAGTTGANEVAYANGPGVLHRAIVTTAGTASLILYDNATTNSGTILYSSAATYALGTVTEINAPFANGVTARKASGTAAVTLVYTALT